jgi:hypothetical protein
MAYGISVKNIYGGIQIDNTYANYYMIASGTASTLPAYSYSLMTDWEINRAAAVTVNYSNTTGQYPLLFLQNVPFNGVGYISGSVLTITSVNAGSGVLGTQSILYPSSGIANPTYVYYQISGTTGGVGTYQLSNSQTIGSTTITANDWDQTCVLFSAEMTSTTSFRVVSRKSFFGPYLYNYPAQLCASTFNWRAYVPQSTISPSSVQTGYGLNVYTSTGTISYSSNRSSQSMRIQGVYETTGGIMPVDNIPETDNQFKVCREIDTGTKPAGAATYPFVLVNPTTIGFLYNGGVDGLTDTYSIMVGGKTSSVGNRIIGSICENGCFESPAGNINYYANPSVLPYINYSYNSSTGILTASFPDYGPSNNAPGDVRDFPIANPFVFTTGTDSYGYVISNQLYPRSVSQTARTTLSINIGTGVTIDPNNPSATSWSGCSTYLRGKSILVPHYVSGTTLGNVRNVGFSTNTIVLAD